MQRTIEVKVRRKTGSEDLPLPGYATSGSSGMDLYADVEGEEELGPGEIRLISAGIYLEIPSGFEAEIRPRSGLAVKHGISLVNSPGTIDSDYRGLLNLIMINLGKEPFLIRRGDRIAQMVIKEVTRARLTETEELSRTSRSEGGFGHTGV
ncbi:MAG: dUTP diphosphatase [Candidatus Omnitrophota bacterium]